VAAAAADAVAPSPAFRSTPATRNPTYHALPVLLDEPDDLDKYNNQASASRPPQRIAIPAENVGLSTRGLTVQDIRTHQNRHSPTDAGRAAAPLLTAAVATMYTPAQIRAAYGLPTLPAVGVTPTAAQAARMGAGQTIYILSNFHDANIAAELAAFNAKYGLPTCTTVNIPVNAPLPLAPASTTKPACTLSSVLATDEGGMTTGFNGYSDQWVIETALDVQWAHAMAPLARIVLIEVTGSSQGGIALANAMGPGVVSMSYADGELPYVTEWEEFFTGHAGMTYVAAAGDFGAQVNWPAVSPHVVAVGGTTLTYPGSGPRKETVWSGSGGGVSAYLPTPSYQRLNVPGLGQVAHRSMVDVAFNADPNSGQPVAVILAGNPNVQWLVVGGTSIATPEWAGIFAIANAMRAAAGKPPVGQPHALLYAMASTDAATYASTFGDITSGANGSCTLCAARVGYDQATGLGTPNVTALLNFLADAAPALEVTSATVSAASGSALSFTAAVDTPNTLVYTLRGAPTGLGIDANGVVLWPTPLVGSNDLTVMAVDNQTQALGLGIYTIQVAAPTAPGVKGSTVYAKSGTALTFPVLYTAGALEPLSFSLGGAPSGMAISSTGVVTWAKPETGGHSVTVTVKNTSTGLSGSATYTVSVSTTLPAPGYPQIAAAPMSAVAGKALSGNIISVTDPGAVAVSATVSGAPAGMRFFVSGMVLRATWPKPVAGNYAIRISVVDESGHQATATVPLVVSAQ
jgi:hypothetical protein